MEIKLVQKEEIFDVMAIINDAKKLLSTQSLQWQQGYPNNDTMLEDIKNNNLFGAYIDDKLVGVVALLIGFNPYYEEIFEGSWQIPANEKDLVIHRIAVKEEFHHQNIARYLFSFADEYAIKNHCVSIKVDTHEANKIMQHLLLSNNYLYRGIIYLGRDEIDNSRLAYEKIL